LTPGGRKEGGLPRAADTIAPDGVLVDIADYVVDYRVISALAFETARYCLIDSLGCAFEALDHRECARLLGPVVPGATVPYGARVPGTPYQLDPVTAAFNTGSMVRWSDFSDAFVATTSCHPSDDVGAILAVADYLSRTRVAAGQPPLRVSDVLEAMIRAHELQGMLGMGNRFNEAGIDHTLMVRVACAAVVTKLLGGNRDQVIAATSLAFFHPSLCLHRFGSNTGSRKSWAAAEAASDAVRLALMAMKGEPGYPQVLSHPKWGFSQAFFGGTEIRLGGRLGTGVMQNVLFKILAPVVIHAQSAIECALKLHPAVSARLDDVSAIALTTHARTLRTIDKTGPLRNPADRDHCLQYAVAVGLLHGRLTADDYEDAAAADPRIDRLRALMTVSENPRYTEAYLDPARRCNPNSIEVFFKDGSSTGRVEVEYPLGDPRRRNEGIPLLIEKFRNNLARRFPEVRQRAIENVCLDHERLTGMAVNEFTDLFAVD
jgi:2-methylcitrate dehydratase